MYQNCVLYIHCHASGEGVEGASVAVFLVAASRRHRESPREGQGGGRAAGGADGRVRVNIIICPQTKSQDETGLHNTVLDHLIRVSLLPHNWY